MAKTSILKVRVDVEMKQELEKAASLDDRDVSYIVRRAIREYLERLGTPKAP